MKTFCVTILAGCATLTTIGALADFPTELRGASAALQTALKDAEALVVEGRVDEANQKLLAVFPAQSRSPVQALALANALFKQDPKASYQLHREAVRKLPDVPDVQFEWALEQHRAGEYDGAAHAYTRYTASKPNFAPALGLLAECLIRGGKTREAVEAWQKSERATDGTITALETLVCEVHQHQLPDRRRADLRGKARQGDIAALHDLIALDVAFPLDWWNKLTRSDYLERDLALAREAGFGDAEQLGEILCAGEASLALKQKGDAVAVLKKRGFLLDDQGTLPQSGLMLSTLLHVALQAKAISTADAREKWGAAILERAKASRDAETFNVAAFLYIGTPELPAIHRVGWDATGDERFAAGLLLDLALQSKLTLEQPDLVKAAKRFPENAFIAAHVVSLTAKEKKPLVAALVQAIKAEFSGFSLQFPVGPPGAGALRRYFMLLAKELPKESSL